MSSTFTTLRLTSERRKTMTSEDEEQHATTWGFSARLLIQLEISIAASVVFPIREASPKTLCRAHSECMFLFCTCTIASVFPDLSRSIVCSWLHQTTNEYFMTLCYPWANNSCYKKLNYVFPHLGALHKSLPRSSLAFIIHRAERQQEYCRKNVSGETSSIIKDLTKYIPRWGFICLK